MIRSKGKLQPETIMSRALHMGVTFVVSVHMVLGCCFHHAHTFALPVDTQALSVEGRCPDHRGNAEPGRSCEGPSQRQLCDGDRCVFTRPDSNDAPDWAVGHDGLNPVCLSPQVPAPGGIDRVASSLGERAAALPLHLLNQALLL